MKKELSAKQVESLISILKERFEKNMLRHKGIQWADLLTKLKAQPAKLWSLNEMENSGGEPDVIVYDKKSDEFIFCDCSPESPKGRRSLCYDSEALHSRKEHKPKNNAIDLATAMGIEILSEAQYKALQKHEKFDLKTSSWIQTPGNIRELGGALFCDRRYDTVFVYHNGADSYYSSRAFRGALKV